MREASREPTAAELETQLLQYRASLYDPETRLPTLPLVLDEVGRMLDKGTVQVVLIRIEQEQSLEALVGWERYDAMLRGLADDLREVLTTSRGVASVFCQLWVRGDEFLVVTPDRREARRLRDLLEVFKVREADLVGGHLAPLRIGEATIARRSAERLERCVYAGLAAARHDIEKHRQSLDQEHGVELRSILRERRLRTLFQPIYRVPQRSVVGYEALSRGPEGSYLEPADKLFGFSERAGLLGEVEQLCVERALSSAHKLPVGSTIFVNLSISGLEYLETSGGGLAHVVRQSGWSPREIVLELTERTYADNPEMLRQRVAALRTQGFRLAIDDMGTGYASLHVLAELRPDYIKLDRLLVHDLAAEPIKRNLVAAICGFAHTAQSLVIAEGVERREDEMALLELGISLVQGYLFGMPKPV
jgi:EAL domain-containing protein (putative c-di-GMP-specific phosphodiesterase class I)